MEKSESIAFVMEDYCSELCNVLQTNGYTVTLGWKLVGGSKDKCLL